jgi:ferredoxin
MAHQAVRSAWTALTQRLNRFPQGAPAGDLLHAILALLFTEREAGLVAQLPIKPFTAETAARTWKVAPSEARHTLDALADRGILLDIEHDGVSEYVLPPPMAGFFEFSLMRVRDDLDQHLLSELLYEYLNVEEDFIRELFTRGQTQLGRVFVNELALQPAGVSLQVLDYERATEVARTASHIGVGICYCRHKMQHLGRACDAPMHNCLTFNTAASSLVRHGVARAIDASEALDLIAEARDRRLVQFGENVRQRVNFICNCCGCCCEAMIAARRFGHLHPVHTTNYLPQVNSVACDGCGKCVQACPVEALGLVSAHDPAKPRRRKARLDADACLGCGVCVTTCPRKALTLAERAERVITPVNSAHRVIVMAIERGTLADLLFDNRALASHRAMAAVLGVVLRLPPVKQALASRQVKSRYLEWLITRARM